MKLIGFMDGATYVEPRKCYSFCFDCAALDEITPVGMIEFEHVAANDPLGEAEEEPEEWVLEGPQQPTITILESENYLVQVGEEGIPARLYRDITSDQHETIQVVLLPLPENGAEADEPTTAPVRRQRRTSLWN